MASPETPRRLIVNADDFGRSRSINEAVIRAHREGILTTASLMVNEPACAEAVELAKENPGLGVGLHLTLLCGHSTLAEARIPDLVNARREFSNDSVATGFRYFFDYRLHEQLRAEIRAQFREFHATGLPLDHVNGHLNLHLHPIIFAMLMTEARELGIRHLRLTRDSFWLNARLAGGRWVYRVSHALIFNLLAALARRAIRQRQIRHTHRVFGLLQDSRVDEAFVLKLLPRLPPGDSELYSHPSLDTFRHEFDALVSPRVKARVEQLGVQLVRCQDL